MSNILNLDITKSLINPKDLKKYEEGLAAAEEKLWSGKEKLTDWVRLPLDYDETEINRIIEIAEKIKKQCQAFIVIGIGGSYIGARAAIAAMAPTNKKPEIYFAGFNISGTHHEELLDIIKDKDICLCVISKSGTTTEPLIAFSILKDVLYQKYGREEANKRIYAITDASKGLLIEEAKSEGYTYFEIPEEIGGRYSVLTAVGLLPIAVAGIDIKEILAGANTIAAELQPQNRLKLKNRLDMQSQSKAIPEPSVNGSIGNIIWQHVAIRNALFENGKKIEIFEYYEPRLLYFTEWLKQLFGESEGKDGRGIFPAALQFSTDLHSMGQFLQEGNQIFFETVLNIVDHKKDIIIPESAGQLLAGKSMNDINKAAMDGVISAHHSVGIPIIKIDIPELSPFYFGQMVYFFQATCALSSYLMGVNPFDQPGVEKYKSEMRKVLENND